LAVTSPTTAAAPADAASGVNKHHSKKHHAKKTDAAAPAASATK
jgi:hypothetical protein